MVELQVWGEQSPGSSTPQFAPHSAAHWFCGPPLLRDALQENSVPLQPLLGRDQNQRQKGGFGSGPPCTSLALACHLKPHCVLHSRVPEPQRQTWEVGQGPALTEGSSGTGGAVQEGGPGVGRGQRWVPSDTLSDSERVLGACRGVRGDFCPMGPPPQVLGWMGPTLCSRLEGALPRGPGPPPPSKEAACPHSVCLGSSSRPPQQGSVWEGAVVPRTQACIPRGRPAHSGPLPPIPVPGPAQR